MGYVVAYLLLSGAIGVCITATIGAVRKLDREGVPRRTRNIGLLLGLVPPIGVWMTLYLAFALRRARRDSAAGTDGIV